MKDYLTMAIRLLRPNAEFAFQNNDYTTINWIVLEGKAPTQAEIDAAIIKIQADEAAKKAEAEAEAEAKAAQRQALLSRLGITEEEARILLGGN
jgi:hypothetical protein